MYEASIQVEHLSSATEHVLQGDLQGLHSFEALRKNPTLHVKHEVGDNEAEQVRQELSQTG